MSLKTKLNKLESKIKKNQLVLIHVKGFETEEVAYVRSFSDKKMKPKKVYYLNDLDIEI